MINFSTGQSKAELYTVAEENGVDVDNNMSKTEIINAIQNHNVNLANRTIDSEDTDSDSSEDVSDSDDKDPSEDVSDSDKKDTSENVSDSDKKDTSENVSDSDKKDPSENVSDSDDKDPSEDVPDSDKKKTSENVSDSDKKKPSENVSDSDKGDYGTYVYIGPSLLNGKLLSKSTFIGTREDVEKHLSAVIEEYPQVKKLLVSYEKTAVMSNRAKTRGNATFNDCVAVASSVQEKRRAQQKSKRK